MKSLYHLGALLNVLVSQKKTFFFLFLAGALSVSSYVLLITHKSISLKTSSGSFIFLNEEPDFNDYITVSGLSSRKISIANQSAGSFKTSFSILSRPA
jgi:hypothetical protein